MNRERNGGEWIPEHRGIKDATIKTRTNFKSKLR